ncbi:MAG: conjugal transfer protein TraG N-terminal domain-containing protein [Burkholderiales bacterium]|nr:conjugal transfer protein TraG N-terminal domain-containing protein [Burkholderiales bacterium]
MGHFVIYTFGNVDAIYNILMSIATFFGGGTFLSMVKLAGVTTLLLFLFNAVGITARGNINQPLDLTFFIKFYMAYWLLAVAPAGQVTIVDKMTGVTKVVAVSGGTGNPHVPLGLVLVNSYMSQFFNALINAYETYFETGASGQPGLGYTKSGMAFGSNFVSSANTFTSGNMQFDTNLQNYFANCALPIANNVGAITSVAQSGDLLEFFRSNFREQQQVRYVVQLVGTNNTRTITRCDTAVDNLSSTWTGMTDNVFSHLAKSLGFNDSSTMYGNFIAAGGVTSTQLLGVAGGMVGSVKQAIAMNIAYKAIQSNAMQVNSNALANAAYDAQQFQQYKAGGELSGEMAARITPAMKIFAESLLFMFYPFMVFYCLVTSNFLPFLKYIKFVATVNAIPFVFEVLNACINWYAQAKSGMVVTDGGFTLMNSSNLYSLNANIVAAANYLSMSVPLLAYALVHGSDMALTSLFGHSSDPAKSAASSAAGEAGKGNMNLGNSQIDNTSYGNTQANKFNNAFEKTTGAERINQVTANGSFSRLGDGESMLTSTANQTQLPVSVNFSAGAQHAIQSATQTNHQEAGQQSSQWNKQAQSAYQAQQKFAASHDISSGDGSRVSNDLKELQSLSTSIGVGFNAIAKGSMDTTNTKQLTDSISKFKDLSDKYSHSNDSSISNAFSGSQGLSQSSAKTVSDSISLTSAETKMKSDGFNVQLAGTDAFKEALLHGYGAEVLNKYSGNTPEEKILDMSVHGQGDMMHLGNQYAESKEFLQHIAGVSSSNYDAHGPNVQSTQKAIQSNAGTYANDGANDKISAGAQYEVATVTVLPPSFGGDTNQKKHDADDALNQKVTNFTSRPASEMGALMTKNAKSAANVAFADIPNQVVEYITKK